MEKQNLMLSSNTENRLLMALSFVAVTIIFHVCYGLEVLLPTNISWLMTVMHDWGAHYLGWYFYRIEDWQFPLGHISNLVYPVGTNVGFADAIPLFAVFFKMLSPVLPDDFQYFGIWLFLCHLLAAFFTIKILRLFKVRPFYSFIAVIFVAANPVLIYRGMHPALCAHWLLIASVYLYFILPTSQNVFRILIYQLILLVLSAWINPYLCFMVLGFSFFTALRLSLFDKLMQIKHLVIYLAISVFAVVFSWYLIGMLTFEEKTDLGVTGAFGLYGLNLNSLYNSFGFSSVLPQQKWVSDHQYEGYAYLGLGMMLLLFIALIILAVKSTVSKRSGKNFAFPRLNNINIIPLLALIFLYTLFSLTHIITLNDVVLFKVNIPQSIINLGDILRASSRFFWTPYYLILLFTIIVLAKSKLYPVLKIGIAVLAIAIQFYDIKPILTFRELTYGAYKPPVESEKWIRIMSHFDEVVLYPPYQSTYNSDMDHQYFCFLAAKARKPITNGYIPRLDMQAMSAYSARLDDSLKEGVIPKNTLYITNEKHITKFSNLARLDAFRLNMLDNYFFIYNIKNDNTNLLQLSNEVNKTHQKKLAATLATIGKKVVFKETAYINTLPGEQIQYNLESLVNKKKYVSLNGWAFTPDRQNNKGDSVFVFLNSEGKSYLAKIDLQPRPDVTGHFNKQDLADAGFNGSAFLDKVPKGKYEVGLAIKKREGNWVYHLTEKTLKVGEDYVTPKLVSGTVPAGDIKATFDNIEVSKNFISASGWGFFNDQSSTNNEVQLVFKRGEELFMCETDVVIRPDLTSYFKSPFNWDRSGFNCKVLKSALKAGTYQVGLYIKSTDPEKEGIYLSEKSINI